MELTYNLEKKKWQLFTEEGRFIAEYAQPEQGLYKILEAADNYLTASRLCDDMIADVEIDILCILLSVLKRDGMRDEFLSLSKEEREKRILNFENNGEFTISKTISLWNF